MAGTGCDRVRLQPEIKVTLPTKPFPIESQPNSTQRASKFNLVGDRDINKRPKKRWGKALFPSQSSDLMTLFSCCSESGFDGWTRGYLIVGAGYQLWEPATQLWEEASKSCPAENSPPHYWRPSRFRKGPMYFYDLLYECTWGGLQVISRWFFPSSPFGNLDFCEEERMAREEKLHILVVECRSEKENLFNTGVCCLGLGSPCLLPPHPSRWK